MTYPFKDVIDDIISDQKKIRDLESLVVGLKIFIEKSGLRPPTSYTTWVDPPNGWKHGFPKPLPKPEPSNLVGWLISEGYPENYAHEAIHFTTFWKEPDPDEDSGVDL